VTELCPGVSDLGLCSFIVISSIGEAVMAENEAASLSTLWSVSVSKLEFAETNEDVEREEDVDPATASSFRLLCASGAPLVK